MTDLSNKDYLELKDKAEKWDKLHTETRQAPEKKRPTLREEELEAQVKSLQAQLDKEKSDYYTNLEVDNSNLLDGSARLESELQKNKEIVSKIREFADYHKLQDGDVMDELKEILGDEL